MMGDIKTHELPNNITVHNGDCLEVMKTMEDNTFTGVVTDPPYGLALLGKKWDYQVPSVEMFEEMLRVTKPGGMLLCFGGSRTFHRVAVNLEDAGWHIRDTFMWIYGSGFPKSHNIALGIDKKNGKQGNRGGIFKTMRGQENYAKPGAVGYYTSSTEEGAPFNGYSTVFKPAHEPVIVAMKPCEGTFAENAMKWGVAGFNIEAGRVTNKEKDPNTFGTSNGRWPSNVIVGHADDCKKITGTNDWSCSQECPNTMIDKMSGNSIGSGPITNARLTYFGGSNSGSINFEGYNDTGGASRFFYCTKPSKKEKGSFNDHPTVKPNDLMEYLISLIEMPNGITHILDPFSGSGSTLLAAMRRGIRATGCELDPHFVNIIKKRLDPNIAFLPPEYDEVEQETEEDIFDFFGEAK